MPPFPYSSADNANGNRKTFVTILALDLPLDKRQAVNVIIGAWPFISVGLVHRRAIILWFHDAVTGYLRRYQKVHRFTTHRLTRHGN
jgi:hypothetical protein